MTRNITSQHKKTRRDPDAIRHEMLATATQRDRDPCGAIVYAADDIGLPLEKLEDQRWGVSPPVARAKLHTAGLPYRGRRAELIYSWPSIFLAEGVDPEVAKNANRETCPHLFDDMLDTAAAAALLGFKDASSIRKLIMADELTETAFVRFGKRGVYRFRPAALTILRKRTIVGEIV